MSMSLDDAWGAPYLTPPTAAPQPPPIVVSSRVATPDVAADAEEAGEDAAPPASPTPSVPTADVVSIVDELRQLRAEQSRQAYSIMFLLCLQGALLFTYLERIRARPRVT